MAPPLVAAVVTCGVVLGGLIFLAVHAFNETRQHMHRMGNTNVRPLPPPPTWQILRNCIVCNCSVTINSGKSREYPCGHEYFFCETCYGKWSRYCPKC